MNTAPHKVYKKRSTTRGFTLVETLVAITIFITVIVGPLTIAWSSMQSAYFANEQTTAIFLAQEALESVRLQRDNNGLEAYKDMSSDAWEWFNDLPSACKNPDEGCDLKRKMTTSPQAEDSFVSCSESHRCKLDQYIPREDAGSSKPGLSYGYGGNSNQWIESPYTRKIVVINDSNNAGNGVIAQVTVTWKPTLFKNTEKSVVLESWLYNQYKRFE